VEVDDKMVLTRVRQFGTSVKPLRLMNQKAKAQKKAEEKPVRRLEDAPSSYTMGSGPFSKYYR
jgi:hypothetical protein